VRLAILVKQVPKFEVMELGSNGRLRREGVELELNPYCRRAVAMGVQLAGSDGSSTAITLGPTASEEILREAIAWGVSDGVLCTDFAFAGSDTLATARALAAAIQREGPFDLVLCGRNSVDADTGQVGPAVAELLGLPFAGPARELQLEDGGLRLRCELDDGHIDLALALPAVVSCAERLCEPAKADPEPRAAVSSDQIRRLAATDLGLGPWGQLGSPTAVGQVRILEAARARLRLAGPPESQARAAVVLLADRGALTDEPVHPSRVGSRSTRTRAGCAVAVLAEPELDRVTSELLGAAAELADMVGGHVVALGGDASRAGALGTHGADVVVAGELPSVPEEATLLVEAWARGTDVWAILAPSTAWGREVAARLSVRLNAGLVGDAVGLDVDHGRLVAWKPAFGGQLVAAITITSPLQMVTVRPGALATEGYSPAGATIVQFWPAIVLPPSRITHYDRERDDDIEILARARVTIGVGAGIGPTDYPLLEPLRELLGAELAGTRKVTDRGWLPRSRQIGLTGRAISPRLHISVAAAGKFNHVVGFRGARTVLAINHDPGAPIFEHADIGITTPWQAAVEELVARVGARSIAN
jgi:electron transfer flavoprotein alpha subunit